MAIGELDISTIYPVEGVKVATHEAGVRYKGRKDLVIVECCESATIAGVFTQNAFCAAPVQLAKKHLSKMQVSRKKYLLINTGNANAGTGSQGLLDAMTTSEVLANIVDVPVENVFPFSTGVIGERLPVAIVNAGIEPCLSKLSDDWALAAQGIMTTDTRPKVCSKKIAIDGVEVTITGIAKGAGMIKPNMATMLSFIATDADVEFEQLQKMCRRMADLSFNRITVDGDTSTNDACMLIASGQSKFNYKNACARGRQDFEEALSTVFIELAQALVKDGEGVTKFVTVQVEQGLTKSECLQVAYTIAESPLVKTALFASDPNWGRLLAAIGRAGLLDLDVSKIDLYIGDELIAQNGCRASSYTEEAGQRVMRQDEIVIRVVLNRGDVEETVWTTDLSHDYVKINAEYRS